MITLVSSKQRETFLSSSAIAALAEAATRSGASCVDDSTGSATKEGFPASSCRSVTAVAALALTAAGLAWKAHGRLLALVNALLLTTPE